jgi:alanyl aminopeptidase
MELDGLKSARQVRNPVNNNHEIVGAFDAITYRKGGGVLQMFEAYLGEERFKQGVRHYLKRHAGGNASARDFLRALGEAANDPQVAPAFESFLTQNGVPVIALEHSCKRGKLDITLSQSRFLARSLRPGQSAPQHWQVPLCLKFEGSKQIECVRLDQPEQAFEFQLTRCPRFVFPNAEGRAYVRLQFTPAQWRQMIKRQQQLSSAEVLAMVDGLSAGVMSGQLNAKQYLDLMRRIVDAGASDALLSSMTTTRFVYDYLMDQRTQRSARWLYAPLMRTLGLSATSKLDQSNPGLASELRTRALELSLAFGDDKTERTLAVLGARYLGLEGEAESDAVSAEVREFALAAAARAHGAPAVALIQQRLFESTDAVLRLQLLRALGWVDDVVLADELRNFALDERLRGNEVMPLLLTQAARPATRTQLWEWLKANVETLRGRLGEKSQAQILELTAGLCSGEQQKQVRQLFEPMVTSISNGPRALAVALERIDRCAALGLTDLLSPVIRHRY